MDHFIQFLINAKTISTTTDFSQTCVHVVMGNESCDLDSMICALALAYYHYKMNAKKSACNCATVLPILNIQSTEFALRTENYYILNRLGINEKHLIFRDTIDLKTIQQYGLLTVSIVDHHVLHDKDKFLEQSVIEIYDHRPHDPNAIWDTNKTTIIIQDVASCATLIASKLLKSKILTSVLASLLHDVIVFDTIAFSAEANKMRELDVLVVKELEQEFNISSRYQERFNELWRAHNDVSHLTPKQLLFKDLKFLNNLPIAGLPMLVREYLNFTDVHEHLKLFCDEVNSQTAVVMGLKVINDVVFRDIAVYSKHDKSKQDALAANLKGNADLCLEEDCVDTPDIVYFRQNNIKMSRKQIIPIIKAVIK